MIKLPTPPHATLHQPTLETSLETLQEPLQELLHGPLHETPQLGRGAGTDGGGLWGSGVLSSGVGCQLASEIEVTCASDRLFRLRDSWKVAHWRRAAPHFSSDFRNLQEALINYVFVESELSNSVEVLCDVLSQLHVQTSSPIRSSAFNNEVVIDLRSFLAIINTKRLVLLRASKNFLNCVAKKTTLQFLTVLDKGSAGLEGASLEGVSLGSRRSISANNLSKLFNRLQRSPLTLSVGSRVPQFIEFLLEELKSSTPFGVPLGLRKIVATFPFTSCSVVPPSNTWNAKTDDQNYIFKVSGNFSPTVLSCFFDGLREILGCAKFNAKIRQNALTANVWNGIFKMSGGREIHRRDSSDTKYWGDTQVLEFGADATACLRAIAAANPEAAWNLAQLAPVEEINPNLQLPTPQTLLQIKDVPNQEINNAICPAETQSNYSSDQFNGESQQLVVLPTRRQAAPVATRRVGPAPSLHVKKISASTQHARSKLVPQRRLRSLRESVKETSKFALVRRLNFGTSSDETPAPTPIEMSALECVPASTSSPKSSALALATPAPVKKSQFLLWSNSFRDRRAIISIWDMSVCMVGSFPFAPIQPSSIHDEFQLTKNFEFLKNLNFFIVSMTSLQSPLIQHLLNLLGGSTEKLRTIWWLAQAFRLRAQRKSNHATTSSLPELVSTPSTRAVPLAHLEGVEGVGSLFEPSRLLFERRPERSVSRNLFLLVTDVALADVVSALVWDPQSRIILSPESFSLRNWLKQMEQKHRNWTIAKENKMVSPLAFRVHVVVVSQILVGRVGSADSHWNSAESEEIRKKFNEKFNSNLEDSALLTQYLNSLREMQQAFPLDNVLSSGTEMNINNNCKRVGSRLNVSLVPLDLIVHSLSMGKQICAKCLLKMTNFEISKN